MIIGITTENVFKTYRFSLPAFLLFVLRNFFVIFLVEIEAEKFWKRRPEGFSITMSEAWKLKDKKSCKLINELQMHYLCLKMCKRITWKVFVCSGILQLYTPQKKFHLSFLPKMKSKSSSWSKEKNFIFRALYFTLWLNAFVAINDVYHRYRSHL